MRETLKFTTATATSPKRLTKHYHYELESGTLRREAGGCMVEGEAVVSDCRGLEDFAEHLRNLTTDQALIFGLPPVDQCRLMTRRRWHAAGKPSDTFTRTNDHFIYRPGPSILMLDYDPPEGARVLEREEIETLLSKAVPGILDAGYVYFKSSSSHITDTTTNEDLTGLRGQRFYIPVADGTDIPRAGEVLVHRLWMEGQGYYIASKSGALLERCLVDASVWQPSRLDFAAGASCGEGLEQRRGAPMVRHGQGPIDTREVFADVKRPEAKRLNEIRAKERAKVQPEAERIHKAWIEERSGEIAGPKATPEAVESVKRQLARAAESSVLFAGFEIVAQLDGAERAATVAEILADPDAFDGCRTLDPLEPDYQNRSFCGVIYADPDGTRVHSFAHGGKLYDLADAEEEKDGLPSLFIPDGHAATVAEAAELSARVLGETGDTFNRGGLPMEALDGALAPLSAPVLVGRMEPPLCRVFRICRGKDGENETKSAMLTETSANRILVHRAFRAGLPPLKYLSRCPVLLADKDGTRLVEGYDRAAGVLVQGWTDGPLPEMDVEEAAALLLDMLKDFRFQTQSDKSRAMALILSPALLAGDIFGGRAPVGLVEADASQTGKGFLVRLVGEIYNLKIETVTEKKGGVGSLEESFSSAVLKGAPVVCLDNLRGKLNSPMLESATTEDVFSARVPHKESVNVDVSRLLLLATSNRAELSPDMSNRVAAVRLRKQPPGYDFTRWPAGDLLDEIKANRPRYLAAVLTIARAWVEAGRPRTNETRISGTFRAWCRPMDWICRNFFGLPPMMDGNEEAQTRAANPGLNWLRDIALAAKVEGVLGAELQAMDIMELIEEHEVEPATPPNEDDGEEANRTRQLQAIGRRMKSAFKKRDRLEVDGFIIHRWEEPGEKRPRKVYSFIEAGEHSTVEPQDDPAPEPQPAHLVEDETGDLFTTDSEVAEYVANW